MLSTFSQGLFVQRSTWSLHTVNIFIITKDPKTCFEEAMRIIAGSGPSPHVAGYRELDEEDYVRLWPANDPTAFELK